MWGDEHWFFFSFKAYSFFEIHSSFESYACFLNGFSELLPENSEPLQGGVLNMGTLGARPCCKFTTLILPNLPCPLGQCRKVVRRTSLESQADLG
uniref:Uncharacterized protein n=1 Tax=Cercocebus atys TaxID=9531 RepID=A0A2K5MIK3_CERAT